jgi:hypothetical protein
VALCARRILDTLPAGACCWVTSPLTDLPAGLCLSCHLPPPQGTCARAAGPPAPRPRRRGCGGHPPPPGGDRARPGRAAEQQRGAGEGPARQGGVRRGGRPHPRPAGLLQEERRHGCAASQAHGQCREREGAGARKTLLSACQASRRLQSAAPPACKAFLSVCCTRPSALPCAYTDKFMFPTSQWRTALPRRTPRACSMCGPR